MNKKRTPKCASCGEYTERDEEYDAYRCKPCDQWAEKACGDASCVFCASRPDRPSDTQRRTAEVARARRRQAQQSPLTPILPTNPHDTE